MTSVCHRCALRLQRAVQADTRHSLRRNFSSTGVNQRSLPVFAESADPTFNTTIAQLRETHLIPAILSKSERKLIYAAKNRQLLEDNPRTITVNGEDVRLKYINRREEVVARSELWSRAINHILSGESNDWGNLASLLQAFHEAIRKPVPDGELQRIIRKASAAGKLGVIFSCLQQAERTGLTLKNEVVLEAVMAGLRSSARQDDWSEEAMETALKRANELAIMLESEAHGTGRVLQPNDPRTRPEVHALFLELAAINAVKHHNGKDEGGLVEMYAQRLANRLKESAPQASEITRDPKGPHAQLFRAMTLWHALVLSQKVLGAKMPEAQLTNTIIRDYRSRIGQLVQELEAAQPAEGSWSETALNVWSECSADK